VIYEQRHWMVLSIHPHCHLRRMGRRRSGWKMSQSMIEQVVPDQTEVHRNWMEFRSCYRHGPVQGWGSKIVMP
jgi:hypothetical protein